MHKILPYIFTLLTGILAHCQPDTNTPPEEEQPDRIRYTLDQFCMGADLSYINQIEDHGGTYYDSGQARDPFRIFYDHGANLVRVRLWHNPTWTKDVYGPGDHPPYSDLNDVEKTIRRAKEHGLAVNLDFHYSDTWADPGHQEPPAAWKDITDIDVLKDSVYKYTYKIVTYLNAKGLMPELVQVGNETNCGMMVTHLPDGFPALNGCDGHWAAMGGVFNAGIKAVRDAAAGSTTNTKIILHVADPKNADWWFGNITTQGGVNDFDIIGLSYYPLWHTTLTFDDLPPLITSLKNKFSKNVMIVETAYPWTTDGADSYNNLFGSQTPLPGYPFTKEGQRNFLVALCQKIMDAGGKGVMYWEPAWITSGLKDPWGEGSSWENAALFDFTGHTLESIGFMYYPYK